MANDFQQTISKIIKRAMRLSGVLPKGEDPSSEYYKDYYVSASDAFHTMLLGTQNDKISPFKIERSQSTFTESSLITNGGENYRCILGHTSSSSTEPGTGANWTTYWTKDGDGTDGAWTTSTAYTSKGEITLSSETVTVMNAFIRDEDTDSPVEIIARPEYQQIQDKTCEGLPTRLYFDAQLTPKMYVWPQPDINSSNVNYVLHYDEVKIFNDIDNSSDTGVSTSNFPLRWIEWATFALAYLIAIEEQVPIERIRTLRDMRNQLRKKIDLRDSEDLTEDTATGCP